MARHLLVTNDYPPKTGGIQVYLHELWRRLETGRAVVLTASSHPDAAAFDADSEIIVERIDERTLFLPTYGAWRAVEDAIKRHEPDLVLLDPAWPLGLLGPLLSVPYGVVVHGAEATIPSRIPIVASTLRFVLKHAVVAVCAGSYPEAIVRENAAEFTPPIIQVPPGVDTMKFTPVDEQRRHEVRATLGLDDGDFVVSSYSRLVPRKGMDTLIRAAARLQGELPRLRVVIGGSGRDEGRLKRLAQRLHAPVTFLGRVPDNELSDWIASSDLMVMDCRSRWFGLEQEGFGIVFVEAAAAGVAQIAGRSGGSHEAVENGVTGLVLGDPRSNELLAKAIRALALDDERRLAYGRASRVAAVARFEWYRLAMQLSYELVPFDHFGVHNSLS
jgi:phosphatidylinositol alpha-1,6-mannosyltransferase